jgi:hypothetical protein
MVRSVGRGNGLGKALCGRRQGGTRTQKEVRVLGGGGLWGWDVEVEQQTVNMN